MLLKMNGFYTGVYVTSEPWRGSKPEFPNPGRVYVQTASLVIVSNGLLLTFPKAGWGCSFLTSTPWFYFSVLVESNRIENSVSGIESKTNWDLRKWIESNRIRVEIFSFILVSDLNRLEFPIFDSYYSLCFSHLISFDIAKHQDWYIRTCIGPGKVLLWPRHKIQNAKLNSCFSLKNNC
jgi:hypothetical protein